MFYYIRIISVLIITSLLFTIGCKKKEVITLSVKKLETNTNDILRGAFFLNNSIGFACGGKRNIEGYIYKTTNAGLTWNKITTKKSSCLYDIYFINDSIGFAGGDSLYLLMTKDGGSNWNPFPYTNIELPYHEENRPAIKKINFKSVNEGYFAGGENYNKGVIYKTMNGGLNWTFDTLSHEINCITTSGNNVWASGFGYIGKSSNGNSFQQIELTNDFFTAISVLEDNSAIAISHTGGIYKSNDSDNNWTIIRKKSTAFSKRKSFNDMAFISNQGVIVGENGIILVSYDYGNSWKETNFTGTATLNSVTTFSNKFYIATENGEILYFNL